MIPRTITVKGIGKLSVKPDYVVLSMELEAKDMEYTKAMDLAAQQLSQLNDSLTAIGFEKDAVKTTSFNVSTDYESYKDKRGNYQRVFSGFVCSHHLKLSFDFDTNRLARALATVADCLAAPELSVSFTVKDREGINEELLRKACINARKKAVLLCSASEVKLGKLLTIDYNWGEINIYSKTRYSVNEAASYSRFRAPEIEPDDIDVSDTATFVWEIE